MGEVATLFVGTGVNSSPVNLVIALAGLAFTVVFLSVPKFRRLSLQLIGACLCFGLAYYFVSHDHPFEQLSHQLNALNLRLEAKRGELEANLAVAEAKRESAERSETASKKIDWTRPVYTKDRAIICPLSIFHDPRADHDVRAVRDLWSSVWNRSAKVKALGCEEWRDGVPVLARLAFPDQQSSIVIINDDLFTQQFDLRN